MNPSNNQTAGTPVPAPIDGQAPLTTIPLPMPAVASQTQAAPSTSSQTAGFQVADDKDVIEPEWVHKAKMIVAQTIEDPYKRSEELTVFKANYMQKRYNKTVKLK